MKKHRVVTIILNCLKGLFIGMANAIPGVSGGTIAVITGIYEPLIEFFASSISRGWKERLREILPLFLPVMIGVFAGIALFANLIEQLFIVAPSQTQFLFIGLILGSLPFLIKQGGKTKFRPVYLIPFLISAALLLWMAIQSSAIGDRSVLIHTQNIIRDLTPVNVLLLIATGMLSTGAMIIPGVSGSFIMVVIGMYATFKTMVVEVNIPVILIFLIGAFSGLFLVSKLIALLLKKFYGYSYYAIIGLTVGSLAFLWPGLSIDMVGLSGIAALVAGFFIAFFLSGERKESAKEARNQE